MDINYKISVIVPVYNGEKYLCECLDSIVGQTFRDFEIVLINDGSKDKSIDICNEYASRHDNIHVFSQDNQGINQTRCNGVRHAKGKWIVFSDQDDSMPNYALQELWNMHDDTDLVIGFPDTPVNKEVLSLDDCRRNAITGKRFPCSPWAKMYRREMLTDDVFKFPREIDGEEDMIMNIRIMFRLSRAPRFVFRKIYNFRRNTVSVSHRKKCSLEHEALFDEVRNASIPEDLQSRYMPEILYSRLNGLCGVAFSEPQTLCDKNHPYLKAIKEAVRKYKYRLSAKEWLFLNMHFAWEYKCLSFMVMVKNFLRYHLGLNH